MSMDCAEIRKWQTFRISGLILVIAGSSALAGDHKSQKLVPVYAQQAPTATVYAAPVTYAAPAPLVYTAPLAYAAKAPLFSLAPRATVYSAPLVYSSPAAYSAPAAYSSPAVYSAPAYGLYSAPAANSTNLAQSGVGNAPLMVAGGRIKPVDREDIIEELRKEYKDAGTDGTRRERRKTLRESARTKYAEAANIDAEALNDSETQDIENIVGSIMDGGTGQVGQAPGGSTTATFNYSAPAGTNPGYAPVGYAPGQVVQYVQPVVPVQVWVPVQPRYKFFHH